jgi:hypothetical protein
MIFKITFDYPNTSLLENHEKNYFMKIEFLKNTFGKNEK